MCSTTDSIDNTKWQQNPPDSPGEWLWIIQWDCGCVHKAGIAYVWEAEIGEPIYHDNSPKLAKNLRLGWEGQKFYDGMKIDHITAWQKITLPPMEWCKDD